MSLVQAWARGHTRINKANESSQAPPLDEYSSVGISTDKARGASVRVQVPEDLARWGGKLLKRVLIVAVGQSISWKVRYRTGRAVMYALS